MSRFEDRIQRHRRHHDEHLATPEPRIGARAPAGDEERLRLIPAIGGRGSKGGAIPGTRPDQSHTARRYTGLHPSDE